MDAVKGLFDESALPTMERNLSTGTAQTAAPLPSITVTHSGVFKFGVSSIAGLLGMYYLASGKKNNDVQKMLIGAALTLGSMFMY
jgi:hypothetical protein